MRDDTTNKPQDSGSPDDGDRLKVARLADLDLPDDLMDRIRRHAHYSRASDRVIDRALLNDVFALWVREERS